jgi:hypothetical protein
MPLADSTTTRNIITEFSLYYNSLMNHSMFLYQGVSSPAVIVTEEMLPERRSEVPKYLDIHCMSQNGNKYYGCSLPARRVGYSQNLLGY